MTMPSDGDPMDNKQQRIAAFFDFDKTLIAVDSTFQEAEHVIFEHYSKNLYAVVGLLLAQVLNPLVERNWLSTEIVNTVYCLCYRNIPQDELKKHSKELYKSILKNSIYPEILDILQEHRRKGHLTVILSATTEHLIEPFAKEYSCDVDVCIATKLLLAKETEVFAGLIDGKVCCQAEKARHVQNIAKEYNLDLAHSFAYSDHHHDLPLLESVGKPNVIHPTPILQEIAKKRDWPIFRPTNNSIARNNKHSEDGDDNNGTSGLLLRLAVSILIVVLAFSALRFLLTLLMFGGEGGWNL